MQQWPGLNEMTEWLGMSEEENKTISIDIMKCLGFDPPRDAYQLHRTGSFLRALANFQDFTTNCFLLFVPNIEGSNVIVLGVDLRVYSKIEKRRSRIHAASQLVFDCRWATFPIKHRPVFELAFCFMGISIGASELSIRYLRHLNLRCPSGISQHRQSSLQLPPAPICIVVVPGSKHRIKFAF